MSKSSKYSKIKKLMHPTEYIAKKCYLEIIDKVIENDPSYWEQLPLEHQESINDMRVQVADYTSKKPIIIK